jgi:hypothetical protein
MRGRTTEELRAILIAGGGLKMNMVGRSTEELRALATTAAGSPSKPTLILYNLAGRSSEELRALAIAGGGRVIFSDEKELFND